MKKSVNKIVLFILCFVFISYSCVFANENVAVNEKTVITNLSNTVLNIISWFAYAIALGALMFMGIKYVMGSVDEKADLKGKAPKYLVGIGMIVLCFTIAQFVAGIAGNNTAEEIVGVGSNAGDHFSGGSDEKVENTCVRGGSHDWRPYHDNDGNVIGKACTNCKSIEYNPHTHVYDISNRKYIGSRNNYIDYCSICGNEKKGSSK